MSETAVYKLIAKYPGCPFGLGDRMGREDFKFDPADYPHLFQALTVDDGTRSRSQDTAWGSFQLMWRLICQEPGGCWIRNDAAVWLRRNPNGNSQASITVITWAEIVHLSEGTIYQTALDSRAELIPNPQLVRSCLGSWNPTPGEFLAVVCFLDQIQPIEQALNQLRATRYQDNFQNLLPF